MLHNGILEETLVARRKKKNVPNHLTDTRIFGRPDTKGALQTLPKAIHFKGYKVGSVHRQTLRIVNSSKSNQHMHIIPPDTVFFQVKYSKKTSRLVPGLCLDVVVEFQPTEWRYYYDYVRIHCKDECNILVPIHAYPVVNTSQFLQKVSFAPTPVGQTLVKSLFLKSDVSVDFEFKLTYVKAHPAISVDSMTGVVPGNGEVKINVLFSPTEYKTSIMELRLEVSQFDFAPLLCVFTGTSTPGLAVERLKHLPAARLTQPPQSSQPSHDESLRTPSAPKPRETRRKHAPSIKAKEQSSKRLIAKIEQEVMKDGYCIPSNLDNHSAVRKVLLQQPGKLKASQLRKVGETMTDDIQAGSRQVKEAAFFQAVKKNALDESNQLGWATHLGGVPMTDEEKRLICEEREREKKIYQQSRDVTDTAVKLGESQTCPIAAHHRTLRKTDQVPQCDPPSFDMYQNNLWTCRLAARTRFVHAVRTIIIRLRAQAMLERLRKLVKLLKTGKSPQEALALLFDMKSTVISIVSHLPSLPHKFLPFSFPKYTGQFQMSENNEVVRQNLDRKPVEQKLFSLSDIIEDVSYLNLKVPQESELLGYSAVLTPRSSHYIPVGFLKPFLSGAEEELASLSNIPGVEPNFLVPNAFSPELQTASHGSANKSEATYSRSIMISPLSPAVEPVFGVNSQKTMPKQEINILAWKIERHVINSSNMTNDQARMEREGGMEVFEESSGMPVVIPASMLELPTFSPLQIVNPSPEVVDYFSLLPNSEASLDHSLLFLPLHHNTTKQFNVRPNPVEVIQRLMTWTKFSSPSLAAMEMEKKLVSYLKPYLSDPFCSGLLPDLTVEHTELMTGPQEEDFVDTKCTGVSPLLTMDMIRSHFFVPSTDKVKGTSYLKEVSAPFREQLSLSLHEAQSKLEKHRSFFFNQLGARIKNRLETYLEQDKETDDSMWQL